MEATLVPLALFVSLAYAVVGATRAVADARTRRKLIEAGASPDLARSLVAPPPEAAAGDPWLRWGLVLGAVGLALGAVHLLQLPADSTAATALLLVGAAAGLLAGAAVGRRGAARGLGPGTRPHAPPLLPASGGTTAAASVPPVPHLELGRPA